jgi:heavy metal translocating P-type ATPase
MAKFICDHCGLPVVGTGRSDSDRVYCCYGCYLVSRIVGKKDDQTGHAWSILRLGIGAFLSMDVMMISLLLYTGQVEPATIPVFRWILLGLAFPTMLLLGYPYAFGAGRELHRRQFRLDTLIALGSFTAFTVSVWNTIRGQGHIYFDTATMLPVLVTFGKIIEATAKTRTGKLTRSLEGLLPKTALRIEPQRLVEVDLDVLQVGDRLRVRPGDRFAVDGRILEGTTTVEEAAFTGESLPRTCGPGDDIIAGTVNGNGSLVVEARQVGQALLLKRILAMVEEAQMAASPSERISEKISSVFIPLVLVLAVGAGIIWFWIDGLVQAGSVALAVLVVACPCAMGIATPLATSLAIGRAARRGILVRGGQVLERIGRIERICFDKTGTLTTGNLTLQKIETLDPEVSTREVLFWAAGLEAASEHPAARALVAGARDENLDTGTVSKVEVFPGLGLRGWVNLGGISREITVGNEKLWPASFLPTPAGEPFLTINVGWEEKLRGRIWLKDSLRPEAAATILQLRQKGIETVLLSGDRLETAQSLGEQIHLGTVKAPLGPDEKIQFLRDSSASHKTTAMVGDGINDAPALAAAPVGIAMGAGMDLARQAGNVLLLSNDLSQIPWLIHLSRLTRKIIVQNLAWAFGYNTLALAAAALGLLHPLLAAVAMVVSSVTVLANSLRLQNYPDRGDTMFPYSAETVGFVR